MGHGLTQSLTHSMLERINACTQRNGGKFLNICQHLDKRPLSLSLSLSLSISLSLSLSLLGSPPFGSVLSSLYNSLSYSLSLLLSLPPFLTSPLTCLNVCSIYFCCFLRVLVCAPQLQKEYSRQTTTATLESARETKTDTDGMKEFS